ncbi:MAG: DedA family protein [Candidatus Dormibacteraceae bacterium]
MLLAILVVVAALEGDLPDQILDLGGLGSKIVHRFGAPGSILLLYLEESGIPLPIPGDVYVVYLGHLASGSTEKWLLAWLAIIATVVAGASNLYLISRRWGPRLLEHRLAAMLHLNEKRVAMAQGWLDRWGPLAIIVGRHIPGLRVPITVVAGTLRLRYVYFMPSVAVSTAIWAGAWLYIGSRFGHAAVTFLRANRLVFLVLVGVVLVVVAVLLARLWRQSSEQRV